VPDSTTTYRDGDAGGAELGDGVRPALRDDDNNLISPDHSDAGLPIVTMIGRQVDDGVTVITPTEVDAQDDIHVSVLRYMRGLATLSSYRFVAVLAGVQLPRLSAEHLDGFLQATPRLDLSKLEFNVDDETEGDPWTLVGRYESGGEYVFEHVRLGADANLQYECARYFAQRHSENSSFQFVALLEGEQHPIGTFASLNRYVSQISG